jgi:hypothetical protein
MKKFSLLRLALIVLVCWLLPACTGGTKAQPAAKDAKAGSADLIDTTRLTNDLNAVLNSATSGQPDTTNLKAAAADILSTTASVLSDTGIAKMGDPSDPAQRSANDMVKKLRDAGGLTPGALDSLKKAADLLKSN